MSIIDNFKERRSIYVLKNEIPISDDLLISSIKDIVKHAPSPFNSQHQAALIVIGKHHNHLWEHVILSIKATTPEKRLSKKLEKLNMFKNAYGTILFFDRISVIQTMQKKYPKAKDKFEEWMHQAQGMAQINVWTTLTSFKIGASVQHYNSEINSLLNTMFNIEDDWVLRAQMPFGTIKTLPKDKDFIPIDKRVKVKS